MNQYVELRHLRYVIAVAEELHFARAANRLHLATPSLSKQIRQLEDSLGYELFERRPRNITVTPAGAAFVIEAREALVHVARAVDHGTAAKREKSAVLLVGYSPCANPIRVMTAAEHFLKATGIQVNLRSEYTAIQVQQIQAGQLDAGIVLLPLGPSDLVTELLHRERLSLALPSGDPLAGFEEVALSDLGNRPFISIARNLKPILFDHLQLLRTRSGFVPGVTHEVTSVSEALELVAGNLGVGLVKASTATTMRMNGVVFRECLEPDLAIDIGVAYRAGARASEMKAFIKALRAPVDLATGDFAARSVDVR